MLRLLMRMEPFFDDFVHEGQRYVVRAKGRPFSKAWTMQVRRFSDDPFGVVLCSFKGNGGKDARAAGERLKADIRAGRIDLGIESTPPDRLG